MTQAEIRVGDNVLALFAIAALVLLEVAALQAGVNGHLFSLVIAAIGGLGGYSLRPLLTRQRQETGRERGPDSEPPD